MKKYKLQINVNPILPLSNKNNIFKYQLKKALINYGTITTENEIFKKFYNLQIATAEEKENYLKLRFLNNSKKQQRYNIFYKIISITLLFLGLYSAYDIIKDLSLNTASLFFSIIINLATLSFSYIFYNASNSSKKQLSMIKNGSLYIADAYSYTHKKEPRGDNYYYDYYVKITDNKGHYIDNWFLVPKIKYFEDYPNLIRTSETIENIELSNHKRIDGKLYLVKHNNNYIIDFITNDELKEKINFFFPK